MPNVLGTLCMYIPESHKKPSDKHKWKDILHDIWSICSRNVKGMKVLKRPQINAKPYPN